MIFSEKLQIIRKSRGMTQEELAEALQVSRQTVTKWESGQSYPDIMNLIQISRMFHTTVDYLVKDDECSMNVSREQETAVEEIARFLIEAGKNTYAGFGVQSDSSRPASHDFRYEQGEFLYIDSYVGGECFSGEEVVWKRNTPVFAMNYSGRTLEESFSGDFLKEALRQRPLNCPFRGPAIYQSGEYTYQSRVAGDLEWFQGYEEIYHGDKRVYECYYHGGIVK